MKHVMATIVMFVLLSGCMEEETNQIQADLPIDKGNVTAGIGNSVTMKGNELALTGTGVIAVSQPPAVGSGVH